jgi:membrane protein
LSFKSKLYNRVHVIFQLSKDTLLSFFQERAFFHGAALAYYAIFSIFPLLFLIISFLGRFLGRDFILKLIKEFLLENVGLTNVDEIMEVVGTYNLERGNLFLEIIGAVFVIMASSAFLNSLRNSINEFYNIQRAVLKGRKAIQVNVFERLISLLFIAVFASIFLILYLFHSVGFTLIQSWLNSSTDIQVLLLRILDYFFSILLNYLIFLLIFKYLNNGKVTWRVASMGALVTAIMLFSGQLLIKYYLLNMFILGKAGIAGSLFIFMAWVHYSSQIIFVGAKFTYTFSKKIGSPIRVK